MPKTTTSQDTTPSFYDTNPEIAGSGHARVVINEIKEDIKEIKGSIEKLNDTKHADFVKSMFMYGGGVVIISGLIFTLYLRLEDKMASLDTKIGDLHTSMTRTDTKLEDLLQRIPPVIAAPPKR